MADGDLVVQQSAHRLQKAEHLFEVALVVLDATCSIMPIEQIPSKSCSGTSR